MSTLEEGALLHGSSFNFSFFVVDTLEGRWSVVSPKPFKRSRCERDIHSFKFFFKGTKQRLRFIL